MNTNVRKALDQITICWFALLSLMGTLLVGNLNAQTVTLLKSFGILTNVTGYLPQAPVIPGPGGTLYGAASMADGPVAGSIFKIQTDGSGFTALKWFTNS